MVKQPILTMFLILDISLTVACGKKDGTRGVPQPTRAANHYVVTTTRDANGLCQQTVTGGPYDNSGWVDLSAGNKDDVKWALPAATYTVNFPMNNSNNLLPGTPFFSAGGTAAYSIPGSTTSPPAALYGNEGTYFYFQYSAILKDDGTPYCSFPAKGMGIHVTQ
jgi:hypothetical protein